MEYWRAPEEIVGVAKSVIASKRPQLAEAHITYICKEKASKKNGKIVTARKVSTKENITHESEYDFIIEIGFDAWQELSPTQQEAVMYHELCHCSFDDNAEEGTVEPVILPHDIEEFSSVIKEYGIYTNDIQEFANTIVATKEAK